MNVQIVSAPHPPEFSVNLTLADLARRDARFSGIHVLRSRRLLDLVLQDSADLQHAHLNLRYGPEEWSGTPGKLDEDGTEGYRSMFSGWTEQALTAGLGLDLGQTDLRTVTGAQMRTEVTTWPAGLLYTFCRGTGGHPSLSRRLNLTRFVDRLEAEFLWEFPGREPILLRAHRLCPGGRMEVLQATL